MIVFGVVLAVRAREAEGIALAIELDHPTAYGGIADADAKGVLALDLEAADFEAARPVQVAVRNVDLQTIDAVDLFEFLRLGVGEIAIALPIQVEDPAMLVVAIENPAAILAADHEVVPDFRVRTQMGGLGGDDDGSTTCLGLLGELGVGRIVHGECDAAAFGELGRTGGKGPCGGERGQGEGEREE